MTLQEALAAGRPLLADGAMATTLFTMGLRPGEPPEDWTGRHPARVQSVHAAFLAAGADIVLTNTFGANPARLARVGIEAACTALNRDAARLACRAVAASGRPAVVAGSMGPLGEPMEGDRAAAFFAEQARGLAEGGADVAWIETMGGLGEMRAAVEGASRAGLPAVVTMSFEVGGRTREGLDPGGFVTGIEALAGPVVAAGLNCGAGPDEGLATLAALLAAGLAVPAVAKSNAGLPVWHEGRLAYPIGPSEMAGYACRSVAAGARIVGGCCGTTPAHVAAMRAALDRLDSP